MLNSPAWWSKFKLFYQNDLACCYFVIKTLRFHNSLACDQYVEIEKNGYTNVYQCPSTKEFRFSRLSKHDFLRLTGY